MVRFLILLLLTLSAQAQTLYCGQDTNLSSKVTLSNYTAFSEQLDNAQYNKQATTATANTAIAPDGTLTADTLTTAVSATAHYVYTTLPAGLSAGGQERHCTYIKKGNYSAVSISNAYGDSLIYDFDINVYKVSYAATGFNAYSVADAGNGWRRLCIEFTKTDSSSRQIYIAMRNSYSSNATGVGGSWTPAGTEYIYIWGQQTNNKADPADYLQTTAAAATLGPVCGAGTTQSPTNPSKCIALSTDDRFRTW